MFWFFIAFLLERVQLSIGIERYGSKWNCGIGTISNTLRKNAPAPMVYRVLIPWIIGFIEWVLPKAKQWRLEIYEILKIMLLGIALWLIAWVWGWQVALITAVVLPITFRSDYWDWTVELIGLSLGMTGEPLLAMIGILLLGLSKETAPIVAIVFYSVTLDAPMTVVLLMLYGLEYAILRQIQGNHKLYCDRWMIKKNLKDLKGLILMRPVFLHDLSMTLTVTGLAIVAMLQFPAGWIVIPVILAAGWSLAIAMETRIFVIVFPFIASMILGWI